jgi:uncharacterized protein YkwD
LVAEKMRARGRLVAILTLVLVTFALIQAPPASAALTPKEKKLVIKIQKARLNHGLPKLNLNQKLSSLARKHSTQMVNQGNPVMHSSTGQLYNYMDQANCYSSIGENVGMHYSIPQMHQAFMQSSGHRANILRSSWRKVGVGVRVHNNRVWVTELFCV